MKGFRFVLFFILAWACVQVHAKDIVKILAIGNSFSEDAIEQNLHELAEAEGIKTVVANLYIPGCSLERHMECVRENLKAYRYRKIGEDGKMTQTDNKQVGEALAEEDWDYVSVQQASHFSGVYYTYQPYLNELIAYVRQHVSPKTKIIFHQTWAYAQNSNHDGFKKYGNNQATMFSSILGATKQALKESKIDILVPAGTAIQNARTSSLGDHLNRDGYHLELCYGRYTAACTWYETIFGKSVVGNTFAPGGITATQKRIAQQAAHAAVKQPFRVTTIKY